MAGVLYSAIFRRIMMTRVVKTTPQADTAPRVEVGNTALVEQPLGFSVTPASENLSVIPSEDDPERFAAFLEERRRVSMSVPQMKMHVPEIAGFHTHWFNDDQGHIERGLRAGYVFVENDEVSMHDFSLAGDSTKTGNQDLGSRVSMVVGTKEGGVPMRAYLMKIREELWKIDQRLQQERNDAISRALKAGRIGADRGDMVDPRDLDKTYVRSNVAQELRASPREFGQKADI